MSSESIQPLINDLRNARSFFRPDWGQRSAAAQRLGELRATKAVGDLSAVIQENQNPELSRVAIQALGRIGTPEAVDTVDQLGQMAVPNLIVMLGHTDGKVRDLAATSLRKQACVVDTAGKGGISSLAEAVKATPVGGTLCLQSGTHDLAAPLVIDRAMVLIGSGQGQCTVSCAGEEFVIQVAPGGRLAAANITFEHRPPHFASVIEVAGRKIELYQCTCRGGVFDEYVVDDEGNLDQRRFYCLMERFGPDAMMQAMVSAELRAGRGLWLYGQAKATIRECRFTGNGGTISRPRATRRLS